MTIICHSRQLVFVRPICHATTSIEKYYEQIFKKGSIRAKVWTHGSRNHLPYEEILSRYPRCRDYDFITVVRNPWDYLVSCWYSFKRQETIKDWSDEDITAHFNKWIRTSYKWTKAGLPQYYPLNAGIEKFLYIIRYEHLEKDIEELNKILEFEDVVQEHGITLPHMRSNRQYRKSFEFYYDSDTVEIVREKYSKVIDHFGYEIKLPEELNARSGLDEQLEP